MTHSTIRSRWHNLTGPTQSLIKAAIIGSLATALIMAIAWFLYQASQPDPAEQAENTCQAYVQHHLKAPSTAEFSTLTAVTPDTEPDTRVISGYVDAQNGFGAQVRTQFTCTIRGGIVDTFWSRP
jgi:hypothetical protein